MKNILKLSAAVVGCITLSSVFSPLAKATDLLIDTADTVGATHNNDARLGRVSRNGTAQSWIGTETLYPGATGTTTTYYSEVFTFSAAQLGNGPYVEISLEDPTTNVFVSAFTGSYNLTTTAGTTANPTGGNTNFLGDNGTSRDYAFGAIPPTGPTPADPRYFQVTVPTGGNLVVVVTNTVAGGALQNFGLTVANYSDKEYTDAVTSAIPEPSTWAMLGAGALLGGVTVIRRRRATA